MASPSLQPLVARRRAPPGSLGSVLAAVRALPQPALRRLLAAVPVSARGKARGNVVGDLAQQLDQGLNFSIIQSLRTGNMLLDMLVCMVVPVLIRYLLLGDYVGMLQGLLVPLTGWFGDKRHIRVIEYTDGGNTRVRFNPMIEDATSVLESTDRNNLLQKAIKLYMAEKYPIDDFTMETNLLAMKKIKMETKSDMYGTRQSFSGSYQQLRSFAVHRLPKKGTWTLVDKQRRIWFMQTVNEQQVGNDSNPTKEVKTIIQVAGRTADEVNSWICEAFEWYKEQRKSEQDMSRFFYLAVSDSKDSKSEGQGKHKSLFKQYLLSDHKTFNSLFFPEKETLLTLIDQFLRKEGKFAIEGFPDKLGLLLDGPPGTGKTSLIKALAHYCNRHVVSVNLAKIKTNQELMDLLFDLVFPVQGGDFPVKLKFNDLIFVMEDVDAASKVVYARGGTKKKLTKKKTDKKQTKLKKGADGGQAAGSADGASGAAAAEAEKFAAATAAEGEKKGAGEAPSRAPPPEMPQLLRMISAKSANEDAEEDGDGRGEKEEEEDEEEEEEVKSEEDSPAGKKGGSEAVVRELIGAVLGGGERDGSGSGPEDSKRTGSSGPWKSRFSYEGEDDLNLAGLLNVLDGVVDSPGRIVVMTTNHPDKLDPALIRPGRINKRIHLGYVQPASLCSMAEHYMLVKLIEEDRRQLGEVCRKLRISPAQVEQCCAESENVNDLIRHLEELR